MNTISVIVPIYNTKPYLRKCVDSILAQTHRDLEVILVDDGSPDGSGAICDDYARKDSRVRVVHKPNGGLSDARNAGMAIMTGQYVGFVDSDDWIEPTMYEKLLEALLRFDADMSIGGVADDSERSGAVTTFKTSDYGEAPFAEDRIAAMRRYFRGSWSAWDKLYRAELFQGITYPVGEVNEDEAIVLHLLGRCRRVCYTNEVFYHYMHRDGCNTITTARFSLKKLAWSKHCAENLRYIQLHHPELTADAAARYRSSILWTLREIALSQEPFKEERRSLKRALRENAAVFKGVPFPDRFDRLRYIMLRYLPFGVFKASIRLRHRR